MAKSTKETPLMKQYNAIKAKHPDALLLFRVGDFYETFGQDAVVASKILGITLTKRANGSASHIELAGFPHHAMDTYLPKLVRAGQRVAICDQLEDPKTTKKIVKRGVTELVTPGVTYNDKVLDHKNNNFLAALVLGEHKYGVSFLDVSTGEYLVAEGKPEYIEKLLQSFEPKEVLYRRSDRTVFNEKYGRQYYNYMLEDWVFEESFAKDLLVRHFQVKSLKGFGIEHYREGVIAAGVVLHYLNDTRHNQMSHIANLSRIEEERFVWMDRFTVRNLELLYSPNEGAMTLFDVMDRTTTPMGGRLLKRWISLPLKERKPIMERQEVVHYFSHQSEAALKLTELLKNVSDLERMVSKISTQRINPREIVQLARTLEVLPEIKEICHRSDSDSLKRLGDRLNPCAKACEDIRATISEDPPVLVAKGNVIREGVSEELDEYRKLSTSGKDMLAGLQRREMEKTGIPSLKIAYNNVFGYYLEVTNTHRDKVPESWSRKQTLVNSERYITEELKELEGKILSAEDKIGELEPVLYLDFVRLLGEYIQPLQLNAALLAQLDCLLGFAYLAEENNYIRPALEEHHKLSISDGRHPVIEKQLPPDSPYIANDIYLDRDEQQIIMITGPNMSGKSALLRQTALIVLMAQMGSFVPARQAEIGLVDKIFTRVGASDNISMGESTFMVEMNETASILNNLSDRSLILLDEIGRGTSTYDGISIAWAIAEYVHQHPTRAKTLFATHYHELNDMSESFERIANFNVSVKEVDNKVIFMRKLVPGGSEHSFGIHVAKMAGMPSVVVRRANELLAQLESNQSRGGEVTKVSGQPDVKPMQLSFFQLDDPVLEQIREEIIKTDINTLTPVEALMKLNEIKKLTGG